MIEIMKTFLKIAKHLRSYAIECHQLRHFSKSSACNQTWSYVHGASSVQFRGTTVGSLLQQRATETPDKTAAVFCETNNRLSFSELLEQSDRLASGLLSLDMKKGDRVGIWGTNSVEWILSQYAAARAGLVLVNVNPRYVATDLENALKKVECKVLIACENAFDINFYDILLDVLPELSDGRDQIRSKRLPHLKHVLMMGDNPYTGTIKFDEVLKMGSNDHRRQILDIQKNIQFDDPANIQFTSGTTGTPKAATLSHHNIVNNSYFIGSRLEYDKVDTRICMPVPLYHCFGCVIGSLQMVNHGACVVFPSRIFDSTKTLAAVHNEKCTALYGVPTMFIDMLNNKKLSQYDVSSLYTGIMAGSPCPQTTMEDCISKLNMSKMTVCYGSTETSPVSFQSYMTDSVDKRIASIGRISDHAEAKVVDENGNIVLVGEEGELLVRGYLNMLEYWGEPDKTAEVITRDRWYHSGDIASIDKEGFCRIVGRKKDMIIRGGENVYPAEVENVLLKHPDIKDVQVVSVPDSRLGEEICACVLMSNNEGFSAEAFRQFCHDKMARYKIPHYFVRLDEFPLTATGKVQKYILRQWAKDELQL